MFVRIIIILFITICVQWMQCVVRDFEFCHDDYYFKKADGFVKDHTFPWLGFVQYIHATGQLHESKAPRVVLVQKQFILGTAGDLLLLPKTYKLGNVIFGYYEQEELDCGLTPTDIRAGVRCTRATLEIPLVGVTPHPEFARFGMENSLALGRLLRPMKSAYMVPVCLPSYVQRSKLRRHKNVYLVDYATTVPIHLEIENVAMKIVKLYTQRDCHRHRSISGLSTQTVSQLLCTTGCGVRPGAPIITQAPDGRLELLGLAVGGEDCTENYMRSQLNPDPPIYVDVFPYVTWIKNVIAAFHIPKAYPHTFQLVDGGARMGQKEARRSSILSQRSGWNGRTYLTGDYCYKSMKVQASSTAFFYAEFFEVLLKPPFNLEVILKIFAGVSCDIVCARLVMPNRLSRPVITGVGTSNITLKFDANFCPLSFHFSLILTGKNSTGNI